MNLIRAATLTIADIQRSTALYCDWLGYKLAEKGLVSKTLAASWGAQKTAGYPYVILQPASGAEVYIRLIEQPKTNNYKPLRSYGWAAIEICNQDTIAVNTRMERSPFDIIGPPKQLDSMPAIFPMQIKGPDEEIIYLTEIRGDLDTYDLPRAQSPIDKLFILVMACSDMEASGAWLENHMLIEKGRSMNIPYSMINKAFSLPLDTQHTIATLKHERDVFLEIDAYPHSTTRRPQQDAMLPPCIAIGSFIHPEFDRLVTVNKDNWITPPAIQDGVIYKGKRAGTLRGPDGTLIEIMEK